MPASLLDYSQANPFRDLDWRWRRAGYLLTNNRSLSRRRDDKWVRQCFRFRKLINTCHGEAEFRNAAALYPGMYWAYELRHAPATDTRMMLARHSIEARLLANQPLEEIGIKLGMRPEVVEAYHECYFEVLPHLAATDYLTFKVLGDAVYRGLRERQYDLLWKLFALWGGPHVLDALISSFVNPTRPEDAVSVGRFIQASVANKLAMKAMVASQTVEVNGFTATQLIESYLRQVEIEKKSGDGGGEASTTIIANLSTIMHSLPFASGYATSDSRGRTPVRVVGHESWDESASELTGDELLMLGAGVTIELDDRPFPPPPSRVLAAESN